MTDPVAWADTVSALVAYSLVRRDGPTLTVHRLIAAATRAGMDPAGQKGADVTLLDLLAAGLPANIRDPATWPRWQALLPHLRSALGTADSDRDDQTLELVSSLADRIGSYLEHHGRPDTALPYHLRSLALNERILGPDHPNTLTSRNNLAGAYQTAGRLTDATDLYEQTLTDRRRVLGSDHPLTRTVAANLARCIGGEGTTADA
ncbi:tetratricopeptide repeat protein [Candidatus Frankia nodulisporulans]|uniref:tetratricopeptide repeat protein n=1 Tax=Candidatus Frankia nodulisporulans TaxID=2060052 RepID=UPI001583C157|nr:tetratricopeptide repeat protein [Candidatus Frankia nodulisporulans]